jgi:hypothetical protein
MLRLFGSTVFAGVAHSQEPVGAVDTGTFQLCFGPFVSKFGLVGSASATEPGLPKLVRLYNCLPPLLFPMS